MVDSGRYAPPYTVGLCASLRRLGAEVTLYSRPIRAAEPRDSLGSDEVPLFYRFSEWIRRRGAPVPVAQVLRVVEHGIGLVSLWRRLRRDPPDVLHFQWLVVPVLDWVFLRVWRASPTVVTVHDTNTLHGVSRFSPRALGMGSALNAADHLVVHTKYSIEQLRDQGVNRPTEVLPLGVQLEPPCEQVRGEGDSICRVLMFGRLAEYKGVDVLIRAAGEVARNLGGCLEVTIAGIPQVDMGSLTDLAAEVGAGDVLRWELGFISDERVRELFCQSDVLALPYRDVDGSGVMANALGYGLPAVASDLPGFREVVDHGVNGLLFGVDDHLELARILRRLVGDRGLIESLARGQRVRAEGMSWPVVAEETMKYYRSLKPPGTGSGEDRGQGP